MMQQEPFLKQVAGHFLQSGQYIPEETCIVFPNKRAIVYFSKYLSELTLKPLWAPGYRTINSLMEEFSGLVYADRITLIFEIYRLYIKITGSDESFDRFYPMTETLLDDFDETDKYLVNAHDLFSNLASLRELSDNFSYLSEEQIKAIQKFWKTFNPGNLSEGQKTFMSIWETLPALYDELKISLLTDGLAYEGLAYRKVAESIIEGKEPLNTPFKKYLFTGFNALNRCEEELFRYLKSLGKADFFYDYDDYYVKNVHHEAGGFIRKNLKSFPPAIEIFHSNLSEEKQISFLPMSSGAGQANALPSILAEMDVSDVNSNKTAVILADEKLLIPVLYSLPASLNEVNVTMGYPVSGTSVFSLINSLGKLASGKRASPQGTNYFNFNEVLSVIKNPLLKSIIPENEAFSDLTHKSQPAWIDSEQIPGFEYKDLIFENEEIYSNPCRYLFRIFDSLIKSFQDNTDKPSVGIVNMAVLIQATELTVNLGKKINNSGIKAGPEVVFRLIKKFLGNQRVPFEGEPLAGIQVMGMLETRTLDFENIIMLSMNEGVMPKSPYNISLVPYNLRKGFGLPTPENYDAISAYYFYRVLQRAKKIFLLYNSTADGLSTGERSRFLHQLYYEFPIQIRERSMLFNVAQTKAREIRVEKTERVLEAMKAFTGDNSRVITPSAINEYINCPLKFYLHYITGLPGPVEKTDSLDVRVFGNILHNAMSHLYESTGSPVLTSEVLEKLLREDQLINQALKKSFIENVFLKESKDGEVNITGINLLIYNIIKKYILQLIKYDKASAPVTIISLEKQYSAGFPVTTTNGVREISLGGIIDRIDSTGNIIRILDYKTGKPKNNFPGIESLFNGNQNDRNDAALQVLIYGAVYSRINPGTGIEPGLLFIQRSRSSDFSHLIKCGNQFITDYIQVKDEFEEHLAAMLGSIFNRGIPFTQTENKRTCSFCHFAGICHR